MAFRGKRYREARSTIDREQTYTPVEAVRLLKGAPPVGPALGQHGVNIMEFCKAFNAQTAQENGRIIPVEITVYEDRSFDFITKTPPAAILIKEMAGIEKGSGEPHSEKVGSITVDQARQIAERKMPDLNANDLDAATKIIAGTARSMGVTVEGL